MEFLQVFLFSSNDENYPNSSTKPGGTLVGASFNKNCTFTVELQENKSYIFMFWVQAMYDADGEEGRGTCTLKVSGADWKISEDTVAPTCTTPGGDGYYYCEDGCNLTYPTGTATLPALGHDWTEGDATTATCTAAGSVTYVCSRCGETRTEASAALGHSWGEWEVVREATREEEGLARRTCARCGETQERAVQYPVAKSRSVQFVASQGLSFSISLGAKEVSVTTQSAQVLKWYPDMPLHFTVKVSADFRGKGYTVFVNQKELAPDADGGFTLPAGTEYVIVSVTPVLSEEPTPSGGGSSSGLCKLCGKDHSGSFWGRIVGFVHSIIWFFRNLFK